MAEEFWYRLVQTHKWRRPQLRVYPAKPKIGIRVSRANEVWHIDTTLIRLLVRECVHPGVVASAQTQWRELAPKSPKCRGK